METLNEREQSEFNMAVSYLNRINYILYQCNEAASNLDAFTWFHSLMTLNRELSTEFKKGEAEKMQSFRNNIKKELDNRPRVAMPEINSRLFDLLFDYEISLRKILKEAGLQTKSVGDAAKALK